MALRQKVTVVESDQDQEKDHIVDHAENEVHPVLIANDHVSVIASENVKENVMAGNKYNYIPIIFLYYFLLTFFFVIVVITVKVTEKVPAVMYVNVHVVETVVQSVQMNGVVEVVAVIVEVNVVLIVVQIVVMNEAEEALQNTIVKKGKQN